jgi:hypothetical protein
MIFRRNIGRYVDRHPTHAKPVGPAVLQMAPSFLRIFENSIDTQCATLGDPDDQLNGWRPQETMVGVAGFEPRPLRALVLLTEDANMDVHLVTQVAKRSSAETLNNK